MRITRHEPRPTKVVYTGTWKYAQPQFFTIGKEYDVVSAYEGGEFGHIKIRNDAGMLKELSARSFEVVK